jgi:hypothetical protein
MREGLGSRIGHLPRIKNRSLQSRRLPRNGDVESAAAIAFDSRLVARYAIWTSDAQDFSRVKLRYPEDLPAPD